MKECSTNGSEWPIFPSALLEPRMVLSVRSEGAVEDFADKHPDTRE